ncbi:Hypothetical predicted protein [Paramuricea clavata]|uniref:Uncharacterized protein n=1 Tax=Paramuricea clavata TaxID=317549 RepID=A0A7D9I6H8_PARCT|nr:Hypothetical predicted protein [Paramuricea clavata]
MKNIALLCFLLVASACVLVARADDETTAVDASKMEDQQETPDVMADEEQTEADETETKNNELETESDEKETEDDDEQEDADPQEDDSAQEDEEVEEDEDETTDIADDEPEKRGWACRRYRKGRRWCKACGCRRVCKAKVCSRRVCRRVRCTKRVCRRVIKYRIVRYKYRNPHYYGYGRRRYLWRIKKIPYRVRVCKRVRSYCTKCYNRRYYCGRVCRHVCRYRKCHPYYG